LCTVTWLRTAGGFELFMNRDEMKARGDERGPALVERSGRRFIAPADGDFGGSWIALNEYGVAIAILNGYLAADRNAGDYRSRGLLVTDLADAVDREDVLARLAAAPLKRYRSFVLLTIDPLRGAAIAEWDGTRLATDRDADGRLPLISSAIRSTEVRAARAETFGVLKDEHGGPSAAMLRAYHASHRLGPSPSSPCMHRDDAETRSFSHLEVAAETVRFAYAAGAPCRTPAAPPLSLPRRSPAFPAR
jgi:transport and Golgi organization protein 2